MIQCKHCETIENSLQTSKKWVCEKCRISPAPYDEMVEFRKLYLQYLLTSASAEVEKNPAKMEIAARLSQQLTKMKNKLFATRLTEFANGLAKELCIYNITVYAKISVGQPVRFKFGVNDFDALGKEECTI